MLLQLLLAETVELAVASPTEKSVPLVRREAEDRSLSIPAVPDADLAARQAGHLDAVAVGVTQGALSPVKA